MKAYVGETKEGRLVWVGFKPAKLPEGCKLQKQEYQLGEDDDGLEFMTVDDQMIIGAGGGMEAVAVFRTPLTYFNYVKEGKMPKEEPQVKPGRSKPSAKTAKPVPASKKPVVKEREAKSKVVKPPFRVVRGYVNDGKYEFEREELQDDKRIVSLVVAALKDADTREVMISVHRPKVKVK